MSVPLSRFAFAGATCIPWSNGNIVNFKLYNVLCRFATVEVMRNYGVLVETVEHNSMMVNNCVFTMMHHIAGDCGKPEVLLQVHILKAFLEMCDKDIRVTQVIHIFWLDCKTILTLCCFPFAINGRLHLVLKYVQ